MVEEDRRSIRRLSKRMVLRWERSRTGFLGVTSEGVQRDFPHAGIRFGVLEPLRAEPEQIMQHLHLAIAMRASPDADRRHRVLLGESLCEVGRNKL